MSIILVSTLQSIRSVFHIVVNLQIQELETENSELKKQLQDLEEQLMIAHVPPVRTNSTDTHTTSVHTELNVRLLSNRTNTSDHESSVIW